MIEMLTVVPPAFVVLAAAIIAFFVPRKVAHALGFVAVLAVVPWVWLLRSSPDAYIETVFLGFDVVLFNVDEFSALMGLIFGGFGAAGVLYAAYSDASATTTAFALTYVGSSLGAVFAGDWLTLVFFWEVMAITSTFLVWNYGGKAIRAGYRYALLHGLGGSLLFFAVTLHYVETGMQTFLYTGEGIAPGLPQILAALGIGVNVGIIGLHAWIPDTYPRPHIAASVFLCAYTTKTGVYTMYRAFPEGNVAIAYMGGAMAVYGVTFALLQKDMRRLLSYHIQAQVGYMLAGVGVGTAFATAGAMGHLFNNILYKGLLFMCAGAIIYRTGENDLKYLGGLWKVMPFTFVAFLVAALSITAVPGFNGFVSKGMVVDAAEYQFEHNVVAGYDVLWWLLMIGAVGTFMSFIKFGYYAFFRGESDYEVPDANLGQKLSMAGAAVACVFFGVFFGAFFEILPTFEFDTDPYSTSHILKALVLATAGVVAFYATKSLLDRIHGAPDVDAVYNPVFFVGTRAAVNGTVGSFRGIDTGVVRLAKIFVWAVNEPREAAERVVPRAYRERHAERVDTTPGETGTWLGIGESVLVVVGVLAVALLVVML